MVMTLSSCRGEEEVPIVDEQRHPIAFTSVTDDQEQLTRAASPLARDFMVYAYKKMGDTEQEVIDGYTIWYRAGSASTSEENTHDYYYVGGNQALKFWDFGASMYHFWAVSAVSTDLATFSGTKHNTLTIPNVPLRVGEPGPDDDVLYSALLVRHPVSAEVVRLNFKRPYAKLRVQFYTTETLAAGDELNLSGITFSPDPSATSPLVNQVYSKGDVVVTYPTTLDDATGDAHETVTVKALDKPRPSLLFDAVKLTSELGVTSNTAVTAPIDDTEGFRLDDMPGTSLKAPATRAGEEPGRKYYYYPLPMGELNPAFTMQVSIDGEEKTATVPAAYMQWKPNFFYTYIFKITEAGKKIEFFDVKIDPWHYGGSQDEEWRNW